MSSGEITGENSGEGRVLAGRYRILARLGRGGMGVVWRAYDEVLGREVAVKELRTYADAAAPELSSLRLRMQREARAAARVRHPGVVAVHDVVEAEGRPLIVMELIDGPSLDTVLRERGTLEPREAAAIGAKVMGALAAAHRVGVLHRDVKPGNILLAADGRVLLTDFGIATMEDPGDGSATHLTRSGELVGSLDYLAPERAQGNDPGPASDIWALGATLYGAVEGSVPFRRTSTWSTLTAIVVEPLPEPVRAGPLTPVLLQLMAKDPQGRPDAESAERLLRAVADAAPGGAPAAGTGGMPEGQGSGGMPEGQVPAEGSAPDAAPAPPTPAEGSVPTELSRPGPVPPGFGPAAWQPQQPPQQPHPAQQPQPPQQYEPVVAATAPVGTGPAPQQRSRGRAALVAAAVVAVIAAAGGGFVLLDGFGTKGSSASDRNAADSTTESSEDKAPTTDAASPGNSKSPSPGKSEDGGTSAPKASVPAGGSDGGTTSGSSSGGSGGSDSGGSTGGSSGGSTTEGSGSGGSSSGGSDGGSTTSGGTSGGSTNEGGTSGGGEPAPVCDSIGGGRYNCQVWRTAKSYKPSGAEAGTLYAGTNYFYCQSNLGRRETYGEWTNVWWAKTDDDSRNTNVWVSVVYIEGGDNDSPVPGLPVC
ncbi:serine/threonine-protein kinase [Streptomyces sp. KLOTTS4A1]|uniref:serine/threonine-protein kinase n=1 Tax=Streptomyces sp. KLOTTS4A1 TaxID=3390996 RepID=UPI0039F577E6